MNLFLLETSKYKYSRFKLHKLLTKTSYEMMLIKLQSIVYVSVFLLSIALR